MSCLKYGLHQTSHNEIINTITENQYNDKEENIINEDEHQKNENCIKKVITDNTLLYICLLLKLIFEWINIINNINISIFLLQ